MKLFLIKSNKDKYKVAQRVLSFKKKTRMTVMNMDSKLLNNHSVHPPVSVGEGGVEPTTKFSKTGGNLTGPQLFRWDLLGKSGGDFFQRGLQFSHKNKS